MGNGDPVTQQQFYDRADRDKTEVLGAIGKLSDTVNGTETKVAVIETKLQRVDDLEKKMDTLKTWDRIDSALTAVATAIVAGLGLNNK